MLVFIINRRGDYLKALYLDRTGCCLWAKRLEPGRFVSDWRAMANRELDVTGLKLLREGIEPGRRRRYQWRATPGNQIECVHANRARYSY